MPTRALTSHFLCEWIQSIHYAAISAEDVLHGDLLFNNHHAFPISQLLTAESLQKGESLITANDCT